MASASSKGTDTIDSVLNTSIVSGMFVDVRILAFSRKSAAGTVSDARGLYANSALLQRLLPESTPLFEDPSCVEYQEGEFELEALDLLNYDYPEDSDLELDGDEVEPEDQTKEKAKPKRNTFSALTASDCESDDHATRPEDNVPAGDATTTKAETSTESSTQPGARRNSMDDFVAVTAALSLEVDESSARGELRPDKGKGREVPVNASAQNEPDGGQSAKQALANTQLQTNENQGVQGIPSILSTDMAYPTWRTFISYAYTSKVAFAPLRSQKLKAQTADPNPAQLPRCSPKSIYRMAVKYGIEDLKRLALIDIQSKLSTENVLAEVFSPFASRFPGVLHGELNVLLNNMHHPDIATGLSQHIDRIARGELPEHAVTLKMLIEKLTWSALAQARQPQLPDTRFAAFMPNGPSACPNGCWNPTIHTQYVCGICGKTIDMSWDAACQCAG